MLASFSIELQGDEEERNEALWFTSTPGGSCKVAAPQMGVTQPSFPPSKPTPGLSFSGASPFAPTFRSDFFYLARLMEAS